MYLTYLGFFNLKIYADAMSRLQDNQLMYNVH